MDEHQMKTLIALTALVCGTANAEFFTGTELLRRLNSEEAYERGSAIGYIAGAHDTQRWVVHCTPDEVNLGQVVKKVKKHLEEAANARHHNADVHVAYALKTAWPCKKGTVL